MSQPKLIVFSSLFPSNKRPNAGLFIRERMFRVGKQLPIIVISPVPWFPFQGVIRYWKPYFRPQPAMYEEQQGIKVYFPRFLSIPGFLKNWDGFFMAVGSWSLLRKLKKQQNFNLIDAHFAYPDGYAATLLGKWFKVPVTITLRGTEVPLSKFPSRRCRMMIALKNATKVFSVSNSLKDHVVALGANKDKIEVVGNGIDISKFYPIDKSIARDKLDIPQSVKVMVSVGALVDRKGFHRVIEVMPALVDKFPNLILLIIGGDSPEGGIRETLESQVQRLNLQKYVRFLGTIAAEELKTPLSAADVFVLATANEGWANVFLEAMACGLPVITTDVGGNQEVVKGDHLGAIVPFGKPNALEMALIKALERQWKNEAILSYAQENTWDKRVSVLVKNFKQLVNS
ncbi:MAG: glycosyltransferase [Methylomarinum sp.]|nr:glycosyltransferase [Methylomarinum sp.]